MILHLFSYEKFTLDYIKKVNRLFDESEHLFFVVGDKVEEKLEDIDCSNVLFSSQYKNKITCMIVIIRFIILSDKTIFHSMFFGTAALFAIDFLGMLCGHKYFWNIWGFDLYNEYRNRNKRKLFHLGMIFFIRQVRAVGYIKGDYVFLKEKFKTNAKFYLASYSYEFPDFEEKIFDENSISLLLGNSCNRECQYEDAIDRISNFNEISNKTVYCILSYPKSNKEYRNSIIEYGKSKIGDSFVPIVEYMNYNEYAKLLVDTDVAIFNHNRQQALGNIALLLYLGKKVYINPSNACLEYFLDIGTEVWSIETLTEKSITLSLSEKQKKENREKILYFFSDDNFYNMWNRIFRDKF